MFALRLERTTPIESHTVFYDETKLPFLRVTLADRQWVVNATKGQSILHLGRVSIQSMAWVKKALPRLSDAKIVGLNDPGYFWPIDKGGICLTIAACQVYACDTSSFERGCRTAALGPT